MEGKNENNISVLKNILHSCKFLVLSHSAAIHRNKNAPQVVEIREIDGDQSFEDDELVFAKKLLTLLQECTEPLDKYYEHITCTLSPIIRHYFSQQDASNYAQEVRETLLECINEMFRKTTKRSYGNLIFDVYELLLFPFLSNTQLLEYQRELLLRCLQSFTHAFYNLLLQNNKSEELNSSKFHYSESYLQTEVKPLTSHSKNDEYNTSNETEFRTFVAKSEKFVACIIGILLDQAKSDKSRNNSALALLSLYPCLLPLFPPNTKQNSREHVLQHTLEAEVVKKFVPGIFSALQEIVNADFMRGNVVIQIASELWSNFIISLYDDALHQSSLRLISTEYAFDYPHHTSSSSSADYLISLLSKSSFSQSQNANNNNNNNENNNHDDDAKRRKEWEDREGKWLIGDVLNNFHQMLTPTFSVIVHLDEEKDWKRLEAMVRWAGSLLRYCSLSFYYFPRYASSSSSLNMKNEDETEMIAQPSLISVRLFRTLLFGSSSPFEHIRDLSQSYLYHLRDHRSPTFHHILNTSFQHLLSNTKFHNHTPDYLKLSNLKLIYSHLKISISNNNNDNNNNINIKSPDSYILPSSQSNAEKLRSFLELSLDQLCMLLFHLVDIDIEQSHQSQSSFYHHFTLLQNHNEPSPSLLITSPSSIGITSNRDDDHSPPPQSSTESPDFASSSPSSHLQFPPKRYRNFEDVKIEKMIEAIFKLIGEFGSLEFSLYDYFLKIVRNFEHTYQTQAIYLLNFIISGSFNDLIPLRTLISHLSSNGSDDDDDDDNNEESLCVINQLVNIFDRNAKRYTMMKFILREYISLLEESESKHTDFSISSSSSSSLVLHSGSNSSPLNSQQSADHLRRIEKQRKIKAIIRKCLLMEGISNISEGIRITTRLFDNNNDLQSYVKRLFASPRWMNDATLRLRQVEYEKMRNRERRLRDGVETFLHIQSLPPMLYYLTDLQTPQLAEYSFISLLRISSSLLNDNHNNNNHNHKDDVQHHPPHHHHHHGAEGIERLITLNIDHLIDYISKRLKFIHLYPQTPNLLRSILQYANDENCMLLIEDTVEILLSSIDHEYVHLHDRSTRINNNYMNFSTMKKFVQILVHILLLFSRVMFNPKSLHNNNNNNNDHVYSDDDVDDDDKYEASDNGGNDNNNGRDGEEETEEKVDRITDITQRIISKVSNYLGSSSLEIKVIALHVIQIGVCLLSSRPFELLNERNFVSLAMKLNLSNQRCNVDRPVMKMRKKVLMPLIHQFWPFLFNRLVEHSPSSSRYLQPTKLANLLLSDNRSQQIAGIKHIDDVELYENLLLTVQIVSAAAADFFQKSFNELLPSLFFRFQTEFIQFRHRFPHFLSPNEKLNKGDPSLRIVTAILRTTRSVILSNKRIPNATLFEIAYFYSPFLLCITSLPKLLKSEVEDLFFVIQKRNFSLTSLVFLNIISYLPGSENEFQHYFQLGLPPFRFPAVWHSHSHFFLPKNVTSEHHHDTKQYLLATFI